MSNKRPRIRIYSYNKIWKTKSKIYAVGNITLPVPVDPYQILYFALTLIVIVIITSIIPFLSGITPILRFALLPYGISQFLLRKKLDGKNPVKYFAGVILYLFVKQNFIDRFEDHTDKKENIKLFWNCSKGRGENGYV